MQQFKRVAPEQLKHTSDKSLLEPVADEKIPDANQEKNDLGNGMSYYPEECDLVGRVTY